LSHFRARTEAGEPVPVAGVARELVVQDGLLKILLDNEGRQSFLDPLALQPQRLGEHPVRRVVRALESDLAAADGLAEQLRATEPPDELFHVVTVEYLPGRQVRGVVSEVFADATFLVEPLELPQEWRGQDPALVSPTHLHVTPTGLPGPFSAAAAEHERQLLTLPFEQQRYPPLEVARSECDIVADSRRNPGYQRLLDQVGYRCAAATAADADPDEPFGRRLQRVLTDGGGPGVVYFGYESWWVAARARALGAGWLGECDTASALGEHEHEFSIVVRRSLEPEPQQRYHLLRLDSDGSARELYAAPGIILMAQPIPWDREAWLMSCEGWPGPGETGPPDPRWQSVYLVSTRTPDAYTTLGYPLAQFPKTPPTGLYGGSPRFSRDQRFLYSTLYGFAEEGGGLWIVDVSDDGFVTDPGRYLRVLPWDHLLSWFVLDVDTAGDEPLLHLFVTGKEVADDFAMTANVVTIRGVGLHSEVVARRRLARMVGWNPVPFLIQRLATGELRIGVETHYNYESSLLNRAKGVYWFTVEPNGDPESVE